MMGHPSQHDFEKMVCNNMIKHCPITLHNAFNVCNIFGPDMAGIWEKIMRKKPEPIIIDYVMLKFKLLLITGG